MTFLVVLLTGLYEANTDSRNFTCALHPIKRRTSFSNEITDYAAAMNVALAYHNLMDDWRDDHSVPKKAFADLIEKYYKEIADHYPRQITTIEAYVKRQSELEQQHETNIDVVAGLTGEMLGEIFAWKQDEWYEELKTLGFYMGKFIYLMAAYDDLDRDEREDSFNPLRSLKKEHVNDFEVICKLMMTSTISECAKTFERLPSLLHAAIPRIILYPGVRSKYEYIQLKKKQKEKA